MSLQGGLGLLDDDDVVAELDLAGGASLRDHLLSTGTLGDLGGAAIARRVPLAEAARVPVVGAGATVWGVGMNYRSKQLATGRSAPEHPVLFLKAPTATATAAAPITLPTASVAVDFEGEVAVLIGGFLYEASARQAELAIAGVAAANDVTARDVLRSLGSPTLAKSFPSFGQFGSVVRTADAVDLDSITLRTTVNGEVRQSDDTSGLLLAIPELLALISRYTVLTPGDVVLTGTPAGTGDETGCYLADGDVVAVTTAGLPALVSSVVAGDDAPRSRREATRRSTP